MGRGSIELSSLVALWFLMEYGNSKVIIVGERENESNESWDDYGSCDPNSQEWEEISRGIGDWVKRSGKLVRGEKRGVEYSFFRPNLADILDFRRGEIVHKAGRYYKEWRIFSKTYLDTLGKKRKEKIAQANERFNGFSSENLMWVMDVKNTPKEIYEVIECTRTYPNNIIFDIGARNEKK